MMIIDYHAHLRRDRTSGEYLYDELLGDMEENGVNLRLISAIDGPSIAVQNNCIAAFVGENPTKLMGCAVINPKEDECLAEMERIADMPEFKAVEFDSFEHGYLPESCSSIDGILEIAEVKGMPVSVYTGAGRRTAPHQWGWYARRHPGVNFVMLHMGGIDFGYSCVDLAEQLPNVYLETSDQWEVPVLRKAFARLSPERMLFGSKYPEIFTKCSAMAFDMFKLTEWEKELIYYENAKRLLGMS